MVRERAIGSGVQPRPASPSAKRAVAGLVSVSNLTQPTLCPELHRQSIKPHCECHLGHPLRPCHGPTAMSGCPAPSVFSGCNPDFLNVDLTASRNSATGSSEWWPLDLLISMTLSRDHSGRSCPVATGLPGWACRIRTSESVREPPNWICVTISPEVGASPAGETIRVGAAALSHSIVSSSPFSSSATDGPRNSTSSSMISTALRFGWDDPVVPLALSAGLMEKSSRALVAALAR